ncbi:Golgi complex component 7-domain-containing protein [Cladochytrium replicatum]|nr:Golgi complex component 7-domain-containing protein [Cladochytrium replicatum]
MPFDQKLDHVRSRMEVTSNSLREPESWSSLAFEMEALFASKAYDTAATKLAERALLQSLQDQLDVALKLQAVRVLLEHDASGARSCLDLFELMHRRTKFLEIYFSMRTSPLLRLWTQYDEDVAAGRAGDLYTGKSLSFHQRTCMYSSSISRRCSCCGAVSSPEAFSTLEPPMSTRLSAAAASPLESLQVVMSSYRATLSFVTKLETTLACSPSAAQPSSPHPSSSELLYIIYELFVPFQQDYARYEKQSLFGATSQLDANFSVAPSIFVGMALHNLRAICSFSFYARYEKQSLFGATSQLAANFSMQKVQLLGAIKGHSRYTNAVGTLRQLLNLEEIPIELSPPPPTPHPFHLELLQFSFSPQPYIIRIGEHLLSLPQHLDMYSDDYAAFTSSISTIAHCAVCTDTVKDDDDIPHLWIEALARGTMDQYIASIGSLPGLPPYVVQQLAADIGYLCNVLAAMDVEPLSGLVSVRRVLEVEQSEDLARALEDEEICEESLLSELVYFFSLDKI